MLRRILVCIVVIACSASAVHVQDQPLPFRRGQWGANLNFGGFGFGPGAGFLRFRDARHAWVLDAGGSLSHSRAQNDSSAVLLSTFTQNSGAINVRLGTRSYHAMGDHADRQLTIGITGQYSRASDRATTGESSVGLAAGVYAELGGEWLVTRHLGLGASWGAALSYSWSHAVSSPAYDEHGHTISFSAGTLQIHGALYF